MLTFPNDENGDVLRRLQASGDNLEKPRDIEFNHLFEKEADAQHFSETVRRVGFEKVSRRFWAERKLWDVRVTVFLMPTHAEITKTEVKLDTIAREFCGRADGWGCLAE